MSDTPVGKLSEEETALVETVMSAEPDEGIKEATRSNGPMIYSRLTRAQFGTIEAKFLARDIRGLEIHRTDVDTHYVRLVDGHTPMVSEDAFAIAFDLFGKDF